MESRKQITGFKINNEMYYNFGDKADGIVYNDHYIKNVCTNDDNYIPETKDKETIENSIKEAEELLASTGNKDEVETLRSNINSWKIDLAKLSDTGALSIAYGEACITESDRSQTFGKQNHIDKLSNNSFVAGEGNSITKASNSFVVGTNNYANPEGLDSRKGMIIFGKGLKSYAADSIVLGQYNSFGADTNDNSSHLRQILCIGAGVSDNQRANAMTIWVPRYGIEYDSNGKVIQRGQLWGENLDAYFGNIRARNDLTVLGSMNGTTGVFSGNLSAKSNLSVGNQLTIQGDTVGKATVKDIVIDRNITYTYSKGGSISNSKISIRVKRFGGIGILTISVSGTGPKSGGVNAFGYVKTGSDDPFIKLYNNTEILKGAKISGTAAYGTNGQNNEGYLARLQWNSNEFDLKIGATNSGWGDENKAASFHFPIYWE